MYEHVSPQSNQHGQQMMADLSNPSSQINVPLSYTEMQTVQPPPKSIPYPGIEVPISGTSPRPPMPSFQPNMVAPDPHILVQAFGQMLESRLIEFQERIQSSQHEMSSCLDRRLKPEKDQLILPKHYRLPKLPGNNLLLTISKTQKENLQMNNY